MRQVELCVLLTLRSVVAIVVSTDTSPQCHEATVGYPVCRNLRIEDMKYTISRHAGPTFTKPGEVKGFPFNEYAVVVTLFLER